MNVIARRQQTMHTIPGSRNSGKGVATAVISTPTDWTEEQQIEVIRRLRWFRRGNRLSAATQEVRLNTGIIRGMGASGEVVTTAGMVFAFTMMSMIVSDLRVVGQLGTTIGLGLLVDTFIVRTFMTPSIVAALGRWFWRPLNTFRTVGKRDPEPDPDPEPDVNTAPIPQPTTV
jgi:MMPL family